MDGSEEDGQLLLDDTLCEITRSSSSVVVVGFFLLDIFNCVCMYMLIIDEQILVD